LCSALVLIIAADGHADAAKIDLPALLAEMADLDGLAEFPAPAYTCKQFSSYDRATKNPTNNWFANGDCGHFIRVEKNGERDEFVMMDAEGPGVIVRIWSANPTGTIRFYLDHAEEPAWSVPMDQLTRGTVAPLVEPLAGMRARGCNLYFPIPYAEHCKVTLDKGGIYYHINYRTYPEGTRVETFKQADLEAHAAAIAATAEKLSATDLAVGVDGDAVESAPGEAAVISEIKGPAAIDRFAMNVAAEDMTEALRRTVLRITFDGKLTVDVPLGDFFGSAPGINPYQSLPCGMAENGDMWSNWKMPFAKSARIEAVNYGKHPVKLTCRIDHSPYTWADRSMLFHAKWRSQVNIPTRPFSDWNCLTAKGRGVFIGLSYQVSNPVNIWWGEGDEKIFVDGEAFPSHFGTGTEDYFGYAWCDTALFTHAYHSQSRCDGPGNQGHASLNRWHVLDSIPFRKDFRFDMEVWHWAECNVNLSATAYWYAEPKAEDAFGPVNAEDVAKPLEPEIPGVKDAIEGEQMRIIARVGTVQPQNVGGCSRFRHMWWRGGGTKVGDKLTLGFNVAQAGRYDIHAAFVKAKDYGIHQLSINDAAVGEPLDFYNPTVIVSEQIKIGTVDLREGENTITAEVTGANEQAIEAYMFGLDYLLLVPAP